MGSAQRGHVERWSRPSHVGALVLSVLLAAAVGCTQPDCPDQFDQCATELICFGSLDQHCPLAHPSQTVSFDLAHVDLRGTPGLLIRFGPAMEDQTATVTLDGRAPTDDVPAFFGDSEPFDHVFAWNPPVQEPRMLAVTYEGSYDAVVVTPTFLDLSCEILRPPHFYCGL